MPVNAIIQAICSFNDKHKVVCFKTDVFKEFTDVFKGFNIPLRTGCHTNYYRVLSEVGFGVPVFFFIRVL